MSYLHYNTMIWRHNNRTCFGSYCQ